MTQPLKPFATIDEQIDVLGARGMSLEHDVAAQWLQNVGYYRLSGYWYPYRMPGTATAVRNDSFSEGADFGDVARLYEFDRKLPTLIHDGIDRVEVAMQSNVSYVLGAQGPLACRSPDAFRPSFDHAGWLATARMRANRARRYSVPIRHHEAKCRGELPIWVLTEVLDFADISRLYDGLFARDQWAIADRLGVTINDSALSTNQRSKARKAHPLAPLSKTCARFPAGRVNASMAQSLSLGSCCKASRRERPGRKRLVRLLRRDSRGCLFGVLPRWAFLWGGTPNRCGGPWLSARTARAELCPLR